MPLATTTVNFALFDLLGAEAAGAQILLQLDKFDTDADTGTVVPTITTITADESGEASATLWPNERGTRGSSYHVVITPAGSTKPSIRTKISVPSAGPADFRSIISTPPFPSKSDAQAAQEAAQASAAAAAQSATEAEASATAAAASAALASTDATAATAAKNAAETAQAAAEAARDAAQTAQTAAESARDESVSARDAAQLAQTAAEAASTSAAAARDAAQAAQTAAELARDEAVVARDEAETFATEAAGNALPLVGVLQHALDQAGQAVRELSTLDAAVTDAQNSIAPIVGNLQYAIDIAGHAARALSGGRAQFTGGSAADPAILIGDVGIYSSAADTLSVAIAGTEVVRIDAAGLTVFGTITETP